MLSMDLKLIGMLKGHLFACRKTLCCILKNSSNLEASERNLDWVTRKKIGHVSNSPTKYRAIIKAINWTQLLGALLGSSNKHRRIRFWMLSGCFRKF